jgi:hypothetical protein
MTLYALFRHPPNASHITSKKQVHNSRTPLVSKHLFICLSEKKRINEIHEPHGNGLSFSSPDWYHLKEVVRRTHCKKYQSTFKLRSTRHLFRLRFTRHYPSSIYLQLNPTDKASKHARSERHYQLRSRRSPSIRPSTLKGPIHPFS